MTTHTFRITVRGVFDALTGTQRSELLARADEHDVLHAAYTPDGHLAYDLAARDAFAFRFSASGKRGADIVDATQHAEITAARWLTEHGYRFKNVRSQAVDLALAPQSKRQRRAAAGNR